MYYVIRSSGSGVSAMAVLHREEQKGCIQMSAPVVCGDMEITQRDWGFLTSFFFFFFEIFFLFR